jgi:exodeoxyribonuclease VII small subunit
MMKYEEAIKELDSIVSKLEGNELNIDQMADQLKQAKKLISLCKDKLTKTDEEIKALLQSADK